MMNARKLKIISFVLIGIGIIHASSHVYDFVNSIFNGNYSEVQLIGFLISVSWDVPLFVVAYWMYRKSKN